jgi:hypothetical protein
MKEKDELSLWTPGLEEIAPVREDLIESSRLRKIINIQKEIEKGAAKPLKRLLLKLGLGKYTPRLNELRSSLHKSEWAVLRIAYQLREEKRRAFNESSFGFDPQNKQRFLDAHNKFNNFCLGVISLDPELGARIEWDDTMSMLSSWKPYQNPFDPFNQNSII